MMLNPLLLLYRHRKILWNVTLNEIKQKYAGSTLGKLWILLNPLLFLSAYFIVYISIFKIKLEGVSTFDYVLLIFSGLIPWFGFAEAIGGGVGAVTNNSSLIKNTLFPIELIPVRTVLSSMISQLVGLFILLIVLGVKGELGYFVFLLPLVLIFQVIFTVGMSWALASLNVFFRDLGQIINIILILLMLVSPIAYTTDMISKDVLFFMKFNPLYYMISLY
ncbi:ABC transporter permease, partial [Paenibacillus sp. TAF58]